MIYKTQYKKKDGKTLRFEDVPKTLKPSESQASDKKKEEEK